MFDDGKMAVLHTSMLENGYEYEVLACKKAIEEGRIECPEMPHSEILRVMELMYRIREIWGMKFPCE